MKKNTRKLEAQETKKRIYEAAVTLMHTHGLDGFTVDEIVKAANVSKGSFYVHFKSKYSLIAEHVSTVDNDYEIFYQSIKKDIPARDKLILLTEKIAQVMIQEVGFKTMRTIYEVALKNADGTQAVLNHNRKLRHIYEEIIRQGVEAGEFKETLDFQVISQHLVMGVRAMTYEWCVRYPNFDLKKEVVQHLSYLIEGISKNIE